MHVFMMMHFSCHQRNSSTSWLMTFPYSWAFCLSFFFFCSYFVPNRFPCRDLPFIHFLSISTSAHHLHFFFCYLFIYFFFRLCNLASFEMMIAPGLPGIHCIFKYGFKVFEVGLCLNYLPWHLKKSLQSKLVLSHESSVPRVFKMYSNVFGLIGL